MQGIQPGCCVKVSRNGERFWMLVSAIYGDRIIGTVDNELISPRNADLALGALMECETRHVYDVSWPPVFNR